MTVVRQPQYTDAELAQLRLAPQALVAPPVPRSVLPARHYATLLRGKLGGRLDELLAVGPVVLVAAVLHGWNMLHSPGPNDDEATYVSQALAVQKWGELSHYTYWYDHPPLGWLLLTVWNLALGVLPGPVDVWAAGRVAMLVLHLVSCVLIYVLIRRMALPRWTGALAVLLFTLSPLGLEWQRVTLLDNIGTPFLIGGWCLVLSPRNRLAAYVGAGFALAAAVLVKETNALFVPPIAVHLWMVCRGHNRRFALALFGGTLVGGCILYPLFAILKNELVPGPGHVSLLWAIKWQLFERSGSGSPLKPGSGANLAVRDWLTRDGVLVIGGFFLGLVSWFHKPARPLVALYMLLLVMPLRGGYLPAPYPINLVWPAALLAAIGSAVLLRWVMEVPFPPLRRAVVASMIAVTALVSMSALVKDVPYLTKQDDRNYLAAEQYLNARLDPNAVYLVDNTLWLDLVEAGQPRERVIWFYKLDLDPAILERYPRGWRDVTYVVTSGIMDVTRGDLPQTNAAVNSGTVVAEFGDIKVVRVNPSRG